MDPSGFHSRSIFIFEIGRYTFVTLNSMNYFLTFTCSRFKKGQNNEEIFHTNAQIFVLIFTFNLATQSFIRLGCAQATHRQNVQKILFKQQDPWREVVRSS